jgi:hypothetical protein
MLKKFFIFAFIALIMASCGNVAQDNAGAEEQEATEQVAEAVAEPMQIAVFDFPDEAENLVGKEVFIEGTVVHVCKHGGKKMFLIAEEDPDVRVKITTDGELVAAFQPELEGSYVKVIGIVEAFEAEEEMEAEGTEHEEDADHENIYHKPQYSIKCVEYAVVVEEEIKKENTEEI